MLIPLSFFDRPAPEVARDLLGKTIVSTLTGRLQAYMITETEAYHGSDDEACHARFGKTKRTQVMFGSPGHRYPYLCYGVHRLINVITGPGTHPGGVLIRGVEGISWPGRVTKLLGIAKHQYGLPIIPDSWLWLEERSLQREQHTIVSSPRVGIDYAGAYRRDMPWRFELTTTKKTA